MSKQVIIMQGLPGSGKSTWVEESQLKHDIVISADDYFMVEGHYAFDPTRLADAHQWCLRQFAYQAQFWTRASAETMFVDNTNLSPWEIAPYYCLAEAYGRPVKIVRVVCDTDKAYSRQTHGVPAENYWKMVNRYAKGIFHMPPHWTVEEVSCE